MSLNYYCHWLFALNQDGKSVRRDGSQVRKRACHPWRNWRQRKSLPNLTWGSNYLEKHFVLLFGVWTSCCSLLGLSRGGAWLPYWDSKKGGSLSKANGGGSWRHAPFHLPKIRLYSVMRRRSWDPQAHFQAAVYEVCVPLTWLMPQ